MDVIGRMNLDVARSQQKQVAAAFHMLAAFVLCVLTLVALHVASARARVQDETLIFMSLASRYLEQGDATESWAAPETIRIAALSLESDRYEGAILSARSLDDLRTFDGSHFANAASEVEQLDCLAEAIYYEARSEPSLGQLAVAQVVMNRVRHSAWPNSTCDVVYQGSERRTGCQFSFTCDGSLAREPRGSSWRRARLIAEYAGMGFGSDVTRRATHYHTVAVDPYWNDGLVRTRQVGAHIFYRFANRRERAAGIVRDRDA
jgi:hypothetical protein